MTDEKNKSRWQKILILSVPVIIFVVLFVLDLVTKLVIVGQGAPIGTVFFDFLIFRATFATNTGAAFSFGANLPKWVLPLVSFVMSVAIVAIFIKFFKKMTNFSKILLAVIFAGAFGNLVDRFFFSIGVVPYERGVIDWIQFTFVNFATFNLADAYLVIGVIILVIYYLVTGILIVKSQKENELEKVERTNRILSKDEEDQIRLNEEAKKKKEEKNGESD